MYTFIQQAIIKLIKSDSIYILKITYNATMGMFIENINPRKKIGFPQNVKQYNDFQHRW